MTGCSDPIRGMDGYQTHHLFFTRSTPYHFSTLSAGGEDCMMKLTHNVPAKDQMKEKHFLIESLQTKSQV